jgi:hypothetical protein
MHTVDPAIVWAKLEALAEGARVASRFLHHPPRPHGVVAHA